MNTGKTTLALLLALSAAGTLLGDTTACADALRDKGDSILSQRASRVQKRGLVRVIARFEGDLTPAHQRKLTALGAGIYRNLPIIDSAAMTVPARNLEKLAELPFVLHLSADFAVKKNDAFTVTNSGASTTWQQKGLDGTGVTIAVLDSGVASHQDFNNKAQTSSRILASASIIGGSSDPCGH